MKKEMLGVDKLADTNAKYDGKIDYLYFKLKLSMNMIYRYKLSYRALGVFKRFFLGFKKYHYANKILKEINKILKSKDKPLLIKDFVFVRKVELSKNLRVTEIREKEPKRIRDKIFIKNLDKTLNNLHRHLYNCESVDD